MPTAPPTNFDNSFARLPAAFYSRQNPAAVPAPELISLNRPLAEALGLDKDWLSGAEGLAMLSGNQPPAGSDPLATVYAGHQFGSFNPQLGDGRAILLGELVAPSGQRFDLQLKGSGRTPYSRGGDGKSPLGPVLREYLVSEGMFAMGVPTTRALAAVTTGEQVYREQPLPGAILTRVAKSHLRIGTLQFFAARNQQDELNILLNHVIERHFPEALNSPNPALSAFESVMQRQAELIAQWQGLGFIHGVMNTDNMLLSGETIDYGPCAFMEAYHPGQVFSSIDSQGRYAFANQPAIGHWNLAQLAQSLLPLLGDNDDMAVETAQQALNRFPELFFDAFHSTIIGKLGLTEYRESDEQLYQDFLALMEQDQCDFTLAFHRLAELAAPLDPDRSIVAIWDFPASFTPWLERWQARTADDNQSAEQRQTTMFTANPVFIPRNHLVEEAIRAATDQNDFDAFHNLLAVVCRPFEYDVALQRYATPANQSEQVTQTFCGT